MMIARRCVQVDNEQDLNDQLRAKEQVIVLFSASWCPFCAQFLPAFERHAEAEGLSFLIVKDDQESMADRYAVEVMPTVLFFRKGNVSRRLDGALGRGLNERELTDFIQTCGVERNCAP